VSLRALFGFAGDTEDAQQAGGDVLGADVGAEVVGGTAGVEDRRDGVDERPAGREVAVERSESSSVNAWWIA
jgi:hypothetical protein